MTKDVFDNVPHGYRRSNAQGWIKPVRMPESQKIQKLEHENAALKDILADMMRRLEALEENQ